MLTSSLVYVAGQIPLDPSSMLVLDKDIPKSLITSVVGCDDTALSEPLGEKKEIETTHGGQSDVVVSISPAPAVTEFPSALMDTLSVHLALSLRHAARVLGPLNSSLDRSLGCTVYLNMGVLEAEYGDIIRSAEIDIWGEVALLAERLLTDNCDEPFPGKDSSLLRRVNADGDEDSDQESEEGITQTAQCRPPPVLVIGVSGIPRDCLLEAEVLSFTELLPKSDFTSSINTYLMQLTSNTQKSASLVVCDDDMSANKSARPSNSCLELLDDLNPDKWPVWYRAQAIHEDFRAENCDSPVAPGTDMYSHEERTSASRSSDSNCKRAVYAIVDVSPTLLEPYTDGSSGSGSSVIFSNPHSSPHGILVSTVRATECSRCVCSGFADVSLRSAESSSSKKEFASLVEENFTLEKFDNDLTMAGNGGKCKEGDNGVLDRAIDLLFLSIFQQMKKAALGVTDLRTLRVYYDPSSRGAVLGNVESAGVERECIRSTVVSYGEVEVSCIRAAEAIFGVQGNAFPLLILPVAQLSVVTSPLPLQLAAFSNGIPIVSANFLFIDLRQIKSETWINGH